MDLIWEELGIAKQHVRETSENNRFLLVVDMMWLKCLEQQKKISDFPIYEGLDSRMLPDLDHPWTKVYVQVYKKFNHKVIPLPRNRFYQNNHYTIDPDKSAASMFTNEDLPLTYSQVLFNISNTNFRNIWESAYKKYNQAHVKFAKQTGNTPFGGKSIDSTNSTFVPYDVILKEVIQRIFGCCIIHAKLDKLKSPIDPRLDNIELDSHSNVLPAIAAIETSAHISVIFYPSRVKISLYDCITYSPAVLNKTYNKSLFLLYQILQLMRYLHDCGLNLGDVRLKDIFLSDNFWLQVIPDIESNLIQSDSEETPTTTEDCCTSETTTKFDLKFAYDLQQFSLRDYCEMWCNGQLSNFDYLTILNNATGRRIGCAGYHHIMPWVTDFGLRNGINWRDLTKSKYRINKGDAHLDRMFTSTSGGETPHHVSDFLSEITYFVYMARRTPRSILCEHVRPIWVPAEYPVSIQRLQEWSPDECIPEFYSDPMVFKSIHEDLPDLEIPVWASCPEDFIAKHREALESQHVSEKLHHWIDLNFGYKLTGRAAIKSKNVFLSLVDNHKNLCEHGIVQLFTHPHPPKKFPSIWFSRNPPRLISSDQKRRLARSTEDLSMRSSQLSPETESYRRANSPGRRYNTSPKLSSSQHHYTHHGAQQSTSGGGVQNPYIPEDAIATSGNMERSTSYHTNVQRSPNYINLPKDFNPCAILNSLENMEIFLAKTFHNQKSEENRNEKLAQSDLMFEENSDNSFTNKIFSDAYENQKNHHLIQHTNLNQDNKKHKNKCLIVQCGAGKNLKHIFEERKSTEIQVIGCLIVEMFLLSKLRPVAMNSNHYNFQERLHNCRIVGKKYFTEIPKCLQYAVKLFLRLDESVIDSNTGITNLGLPIPSAHQILQPILENLIIPFPPKYIKLFSLMRSIHKFDLDLTLLMICTHFRCDGKQCTQYEELDRKRVIFNRKIAECKVKAFCAHIENVLHPIAYEQFNPIELILPHIIDMLRNEETSILTAWYLFDPIAAALGIRDTQKHLLEPMLRLYDATEGRDTIGRANMKKNSIIRFSISSSFKSRKSVKLYHHSFLLRLIVRFGLKCFLENFISPLIEAVGGYKEPEENNGFHYHSNDKYSLSTRSARNLRYCCTDESDNSLTLISPEHSDMKSLGGGVAGADDDNTLSFDASTKPEIENLFTFDGELDESSDKLSNNAEFENKSIDSFDMRINQITAEEATEDATTYSFEKLALDDIIKCPQKLSNNSFEDIEKISSAKSSQVGSPPQKLDLDAFLGPKSPTIPIPSSFRRNYELNTIDCEIGSKKSFDSIDISASSADVSTTAPTLKVSSCNSQQTPIILNENNRSNAPSMESVLKRSDSIHSAKLPTSMMTTATTTSEMTSGTIDNKAVTAANQNRISEMSTESIIWLSHRLGPVLTAKYLTRNLLRMLTLCYVGQENLLPDDCNLSGNAATNLNYFTVADSRVVGDHSAARVLECLTSIAALFGEQFIVLQYLPHVSELITLCRKKITSGLEGAIISSLQLLKYLIPCLLDTTIMDQLQDVILGNIIYPVIRLLSSTQYIMPSGFLSRSLLARKLVDAIYVLCVRIGPEMSKEHLCVPALQNFFLIFDKAYGIQNNFKNRNFISSDDLNKKQSPDVKNKQNESGGIATGDNGISPPLDYYASTFNTEDGSNFLQIREKALEEIRDVFTPNLAHSSYLTFLRFLGESIMSKTIVNLEFILTLCHEFEQPNYSSDKMNRHYYSTISSEGKMIFTSDDDSSIGGSISFGTSVIGNRIEVKPILPKNEIGPMEVLDMVAYKLEQVNIARHLRGNWLAYWEHEIGRSEKDNHLNLKQIKLQTFAGHSNSVRAILALDNENSFMSASKDKTVKLWSLRSEGDGKKVTSCQYTYANHKKSVHSLTFLESMRLVASCDSGVHVWDPFIGRPIGILDSQSKYSPVSVVRSYPSPSPLILAGTAESTVKIIDSRSINYVTEWKVTTNQNSTVRCLACAPSGNWIAVGLSSGTIILLDGRMGTILTSRKVTDGELLQLITPNDYQVVSSSLDHSISVWNVVDNGIDYQLKQPTEPAHCLYSNGQELVFATPANRIGTYSDLLNLDSSYSITKLRSEILKGVLTSFTVLPLNRTMLAGNDSGNIVLLC